MNGKRSFLGCLLLIAVTTHGQQAGGYRPETMSSYPALTTSIASHEINSSQAKDSSRISVPVYFQLLAGNFTEIAKKPFHLEKKDWHHIGEFAVVATGLSFADEAIQQQALQWRNESPTLRKISGTVTQTGGLYEFYILGGLGLYSFTSKNEKLRTSVLLATQAYITSAVVTDVLKRVTGRQRPYIHDLRENEPEPRFHGLLGQRKIAPALKSNNSFPSGHTTVAFAAATVFAMQYKDHPVIPVIAYSLAGLTGISRITENQHWATDVLAGAAVGILSGRLAVHVYRNHMLMKKAEENKNTLHFNLQYINRQVTPGFLYCFN
jgi:membrane-associated phospholipid phosphatase